MKISFVTFGCKVNTSENEKTASALSAKGFKITEIAQADIVLINTCAVTEAAAKRCGAYISNLRRKNPEIKIVVTGCLATDKDEDLKALGADVVVTNGSKGSLEEHIMALTDGMGDVDSASFYGGGPLKGFARTRAFFKIQDGCDAFCAYCAIPRLRGKPRSKPIEEAVAGFAQCVKNGFKEIVLVGIHVGLYGRGLGYGLTELLKKLLETKGDYRIRLTSIEVNEITPELIDLILSSKGKICPHLHIPLQSGSNAILKKMGRRYLAADYIKTVKLAKSRIEGLTVGSDVITGFPGETEDHFQETIETLKAAGAEFVHVFPYSDRRGTVASSMAGKLPEQVKEGRAAELRGIWEEETLSAMKALIGKTLTVLTERGNKGHGGNYMPVLIEETVPANTFVKVTIKGISKGKLYGSVKG